MADESPRSELAMLACDELATYFEHLARRVEELVRVVRRVALDEALRVRQQRRAPGAAPDGQPESLIAARRQSGTCATAKGVHGGQPAPPPTSFSPRFRDAVAMVAPYDQGPGRSRTHRPGRGSGADPVAARPLPCLLPPHLNNHIGQMSYLVKRLRPGTGPEPTW